MRGLTKGPPPANVSPIGQQPGTLAQWAATCATSLQAITDPKARTKHARTLFDSMYKLALRRLLFVEQYDLCVYCERQVEETTPPPPIDHWDPLSAFLHHAFTWENLHVSCRSVDTCDDRKKDESLNLPWPVNLQYENYLGFTSGGRMYVRNDVTIAPALLAALELALEDQPGPPRVKSTLNLNHPALRAAREAAIQVEEDTIALSPQITQAERQRHVAAMLAKPRRDDFVSARVAAWSQQLGVGR